MMTERYQPIEIDAGSDLRAVTFSADGEYLVSGVASQVRVWRMEDAKLVATMVALGILCVAVSRDGLWIAAGTGWGKVCLWDAKTHERVLTHKQDERDVNGVDFSADSASLVSASDNSTATVWDPVTHKQVQILRHEGPVIAAKYASQGDRIATATRDHVRVWDSDGGSLLVDIPVEVTPYYNTGLLWSGTHLFVVSDRKIKEFDASSTSTVSLAEWSVPVIGQHSCIALPKHECFIAYSTTRSATCWDTSTHSKLALFNQHPQDIRSIAISPDDRSIAVGGKDGKITFERLSRVTSSIPLSRLHPTLQEPPIQIDPAALDSWEHGRLENAEELLSIAISTSRKPNHHALANRALIRARLRKWDTALADAEMAIRIQPSVVAYIAKSIAHVGDGEKHKGYRACDIASERFHSSHVTFLLLVKAIIVFMAGEHPDAISRVDDLIAMAPFISSFYAVQAYMCLLLGNSCMESGGYEDAIQSFQRARAQMRHHDGQTLSVISLIFGWGFDNLNITIRQRLCEALYSAGRPKDAGESLLELVRSFEEEVYARGATVKWVSDFTQRCLSTPKRDGDAASTTSRRANTPTPHPNITFLLREWAKATLASHSWNDALVTAAAFVVPRSAIYRAICERLEAVDCITDAIECFHEMMNELGRDVSNRPTVEWVCDFAQRRLSAPTNNGDAVSNVIPTPLLREWAKAKLIRGSWEDAILSAANFTHSRVVIYQVICERLETTDHIADAVMCFHQMMNELGGKMNLHCEHREWALGFRQRSSRKPELLGDTAVDAHQHNEATSYYSAALSLDPPFPQGILLKRSKAYLATESWKQALDDANEVIALDPSSPWGYEMKHAALHQGGDYDNAVDAFEAMLSKIEQSPDPEVQRLGDRYIRPSSTRATIRKIVHKTARRLPRELINTTNGCLYNRAEQASAFQSSPNFKELVSSMTTHIDYVRIKCEVRQYFQYVMLSHCWEDDEPLFQQVIHISVYDLDQSPTHDKLRTFCKIVQDTGFIWAWSDTCCINKSDHFILQEALVAMFKWYEGSALTIVYLRGVCSTSQLGALMKSLWNTRAWTLQEYIAAKAVRFYTEDWTPYLDLQLPNHKESWEVITEMEQATGVSAEELMALRPGLTSIREKLRLASTRQTTYVEDAAYSLLGIFSSVGISAIYGEGEASLGRLLANVLTRSGDVSILAWTGESGRFNSCLPARIGVFNGSASSHLPQRIPDTEMETIIAAFHTSPFDLDAALKLYDRVRDLPTPRFAESRMTLPCIAVRLRRLSSYRTNLGRVFRADTDAFGMVEIRTRHDLFRMGALYFVHPWLESLLEHEDVQSGAFDEDDTLPHPSPHLEDEEIDDEEIADQEFDDEEFDESSALSEPESLLHPTPDQMVPMDREMRARRLVARLRQPFGALLLTLMAAGRRVVGYKRVAADSVINVQFQENFSLADILDRVRAFDVL